MDPITILALVRGGLQLIQVFEDLRRAGKTTREQDAIVTQTRKTLVAAFNSLGPQHQAALRPEEQDQIREA
jgi:hypothetical protein